MLATIRCYFWQRNEKSGQQGHKSYRKDMSFTEIKLNTAQLTGLYGSHIVIAEKNNTNPTPAGEKSKAFTGKNKQHFLWIIHEPSRSMIADEDFGFLNSVISACGMSMDDIVLVNHAKHTALFEELADEFQPVNMIVSGVNDLVTPVLLTPYRPEKTGNITVMLTEELGLMAGDKSRKSKLWTGLKKMLGI
jgi:hypothetical protein